MAYAWRARRPSNTVRRNKIYDNRSLGINLVGGREVLRKPMDGVTPNDEDDNDDGPNHLMNFLWA